MSAPGEPRKRQTRTLIKVLGSITIFLVGFGAAEILSWVAGTMLVRKGVFYQAQEVDGYQTYLSERDPVLAWPAPSSYGSKNLDETGSRIIPSFADTREACVSLYGDSFTWGGAVDSEHAWSNVLSKLLGCRVSNFGVGAYGSDQAYLRFVENASDDAPEVILGHLSENILRNVNQLRGLLYSGTKYGLKPRFVLDEEGRLELVPLPRYAEEEFRRVVARPEQHLKPQHEYFLPGGPTGTLRLEFPYSISMLRAIGHFHVLSEFAGEPWYLDFYQPDHAAGGLDVTLQILTAFERTALERGKRPTVLLIPTGTDFTYFAEHGVWSYQPLVDRLAERGIRTLDAGPAMFDRLKGRDPCELFHDCSGHFNEEGETILADVVYEHFRGQRAADRKYEPGLRSTSE